MVYCILFKWEYKVQHRIWVVELINLMFLCDLKYILHEKAQTFE